MSVLGRAAGVAGSVRRLLALTLALLLGLVTVGAAAPSPALAATGTGGLQVTKQLDTVQGQGFTAPNTFQTGALVRYRIAVSCSSNEIDCGVITIVDDLDPNLVFQSVIKPTTPLPITTSAAGSDPVQIVIGTSTTPVPGGTTLEFILVAKVVSSSTTGIIPNDASGTSTSGGTATSDVVNINVPKPAPNYDITKRVGTPSTVAPGENLSWGIYLYGAALNNVEISSVTVVDTYPAGAVVVDAAGGVVNTANNTITWTNVPVTLAEIVALNASYNPWKIVVLNFPASAFPGGQTVTNNVAVEWHYKDGTTGTDTSSATGNIAAATPGGQTTKTAANSSVIAGQQVSWTVSFTNTGNTTLTNVEVTDIFPTSGLTNATIKRTDYTSPVYPTSKGPVMIQTTTNGTSFTDWVQYMTNGNSMVMSTGAVVYDWPALPAGTTGVRLIDQSVAPGDQMKFSVNATVDASVAAGTQIRNCATTTATGLTGTTEGCATVTVVAPYVDVYPFKGVQIPDPASGSTKPGDLVQFAVGGGFTAGIPVTSGTIADLLPPQFEYVRTECVTSHGYGSGFGNSAILAFRAPECSDSVYGPDPSINTTVSSPIAGTTQLQWNNVPTPIGYATFVVFTARVKAGTAIGSYTNTSYLTTNAVPSPTCQNSSGTPELVDLDGDGTVDTVCQATAPVLVSEAAIAQVEKWDIGTKPNVLQTTAQPDASCPDWDGFTRYPCVAQTDPDTDFQYRFKFTNYGNINLTNYVAYDILPFIGDTGVVESLTTSPRGTVWRPVLTGPLTVNTAMTTATNANVQVLYNLTSNPCRPELANGLNDATWQTGCDNTWYTAAQVTDWSAVKSFKVLAFHNGEAWAPATDIIMEATMHAPAGAPASSLSGSNVNLSIAWNSIGHREFRQNADGTTVRLLAAEPRKVGIIVPLAPAVSVGDYVWMDANRDGLQTAGETPVPNVVVNLYDAAGNFVRTTTTNADGYYSFVGLTPGAVYTLEFIKPAGYVWTTQDVNGTSNVQATDGTDSDVDPATGKVTFTAPASGSNLPGGPTIATNTTDNPSLDAGLTDVPPVLVSVGDYVWFDHNRDGLQTVGEPPVAGVTVTLKDSAGAVVGTTTTDAAGYYEFLNLAPSTAYTVTFSTLPAGSSWTTQNVSGVTDNNLTTDNKDSDVNPVDGTIAFTTPATGVNGSGAFDATDLPTLDGGLVVYNLTLDKVLSTAGVIRTGSTVTFTLTPHNAGPSTALGGWSVTDVLPAGLTAVSITPSSADYSCTLASLTCTNSKPFAAGADMGFITITATVDAGATGPLTNLAFVKPAAGDTPETNPLGPVPTVPTDASTTPTDNDSSVPVSLTPYVSVGDYVWYDVNRDGAQTAGEAPYAGMTVNLFAGTDTSVAPLQTTTTNAAGYYSFVNLEPSTQYTIVFVKAATESFTTQDVYGVISNTATGDHYTDSDADVASGAVTFTTTETGLNRASVSSGLADNPGIDAGIVKYNLKLAKVLTTAGPFTPGQTVTYTLTPHNDGPVAAMAGWSVTDVLPTGLTLVSMSGAGYDCTTTPGTCVAAGSLAAGADGPLITVTATIGASFTGAGKNVAYVKPAATDGPETNPLVTPTLTTDTTTSPTDNDAEASLTVAKVSIGDYVWWDTNRDGQQSAGELPVAGVVVNLYDAQGVKLTSTTTDAAGFYSFTDLLPSTAYTVEFVKPADTVFTTALTGTDRTLDSNADVTTGKYTVTTPATGANSATTPDDPTIDAGLVELVSVGDYVWYDANRDGQQTTGELPVAGVGVNLLSPSSGAVIKSTVTDANGFYSFTDLLAGASYMVEFVKPADTVFTTALTGATATDSNADPASGIYSFTAPATGANSATTPDDPTLDAGLVELVSIGDYVWFDSNRDGQQTAGEAAVAGVTVNLLDASGAVVKSTVTDANGFYSFTDLFANTSYTVEFVKPADTVFTTALTGAVATDSNADPVSGRYTVVTPTTGANSASSPDDPSIDAGLVELVSIGDYVWFDGNRDGLQTAGELPVAGVVVNLLDAAGVVVKTTTTDASGFYSFTDLFANTSYTVEFVKPAGTVFTGMMAGADPTLDSNADLSTGKYTLVTPATGANSATAPDDPTIDAGLVELVSIGDYVWYDANRDGQQTTGESPVPGVTVNLLDAAGVVVKTTTTNASGFYSFTDLLANTSYTVEFVKPAGTVFTTALTGATTTDSNADVTTGKYTVTTPATGANSATTPDDPSIDAGLVELVSVGDYVWYDANRDGQQTTGELPVAGVVVNLYDAAGVLVKTATTDASGFYSFTDLIAGASYTVEFVKPADTVFTTALTGAAALDSNADPVTGKYSFTAPATGNNSATAPDDASIDAGLVELVSIGNVVWWDTNRDGLQTEGELPVAGVVVNLYDAAGALVKTATTDATGFYSFTGLFANTSYTVEFVKPADTVFTTAVAGTDRALDSNADPVTGKYTLVTPTTGANSATTPDDPSIDAGLVELVSIGDHVWWDTNRDGLQTAGEAPVAGVVVNLYDAAGVKVATTTTDSTGFYSFTNLIGGATYTVEFVKPADSVFTAAGQGSDRALDSNADMVTGKATIVAPTTGTNSASTPDDASIDAGLVELVSIGDVVWGDDNRDGLQTDGEPILSGVVVNLYDAAGVKVKTTTTNTDGYYSFTDLYANTSYTVEFVKPAGTSFTGAMAGADKAIDSNADVTTGKYTLVTPATGANSATTPDDPTIDAGLVAINLRLTKTLVTTGTVKPGDQVTFTLTPRNDGPSTALAGWSVTEVLPSGMTLVSMTGTGYTCTGVVCVASMPLAGGTDGPTITVVVTVSGSGSLRNVAYVSPSDKDVPEKTPLGPVPAPGTDTSKTPTDNDADAPVVITVPKLPQTGAAVELWQIALAMIVVAAGGVLIVAGRRRQAKRGA